MPRRLPIVALIALAVAACGSGEAASPPAGTVGDVGELPGGLPAETNVPSTSEVEPETSSPTTDEDDDDEPPRRTTTRSLSIDPESRRVGDLVEGNRLLVIGDSILASTSRRYGGEMCNRLVPMGWAVELDAETGQPIEFGTQVLRQRLPDGWDAAVVMLGNNYNGNAQAYADELEEIVDLLAPRPVVLLTVTEFREDRAGVNWLIRTIADRQRHVRVVEWAERTADGEAEGLLSGDGLHLTDDGRRELVAMTSRALGRAPVGSDGECLSTRYTDDSAGPPDGPAPDPTPSGGDNPRRGGSPPAVTVGPPVTAPPTPTTVAEPPPATQPPAPATTVAQPPPATQPPTPTQPAAVPPPTAGP